MTLGGSIAKGGNLVDSKARKKLWIGDWWAFHSYGEEQGFEEKVKNGGKSRRLGLARTRAESLPFSLKPTAGGTFTHSGIPLAARSSFLRRSVR